MIIKIVFSYLGTNFHGSAENHGVRTVVGDLRKVLQKLLGYDIKFDLAGRTDAGVHARGQVVSFYCDISWGFARFKSSNEIDFCNQLKRRAQRLLPSDISINTVDIEHQDFSARFSTKSRTYKYRIIGNEENVIPAYESQNYWIIDQNLNIEKMSQASKLLIGEHDFASFSKPGEGRSTTREIYSSQVTYDPDSTLCEYTIIGNAFCWQMVRGIVGSLYEVGIGKMSIEYFQDMIDNPFRQKIKTIAPPQGLYLWEVIY